MQGKRTFKQFELLETLNEYDVETTEGNTIHIEKGAQGIVFPSVVLTS